MGCEKCWADAFMRAVSDTSKSQAEHYRDLLQERKDNPCTPRAAAWRAHGDPLMPTPGAGEGARERTTRLIEAARQMNREKFAGLVDTLTEMLEQEYARGRAEGIEAGAAKLESMKFSPESVDLISRVLQEGAQAIRALPGAAEGRT